MSVASTEIRFAESLAESGLLDERLVQQVQRHFPIQTQTAEGFASLLVTRNLLTRWQADKLLRGKHRGFLLGPYKLRSHLARGGMSTLYVAEHAETGKICALKVLPPSKAGEASYLPRFLREAELAAELDHPNIMRVFEVHSCINSGHQIHFMAMEWLHGYDLFNSVTVRGPLPIRESAEIIRQSALGLQHAHDCGLVHRDVKPGNLFLTDDGTVKIVDLGLAAILEGQMESLTRQHDERVLGTADYLAPEQAVDSHRVDSRADIYALGCAFYFILAGRPPFVDGSLAQRILAHQKLEPRDISEIRSDVPIELQVLLKAMLVKRRAKRVQTCREVADVLSKWLEATRHQPEAPPQLIESPSGIQRRKLKRLSKRSGLNAETPTDSIRAMDTARGNSPSTVDGRHPEDTHDD